LRWGFENQNKILNRSIQKDFFLKKDFFLAKKAFRGEAN